MNWAKKYYNMDSSTPAWSKAWIVYHGTGMLTAMLVTRICLSVV